MDSEAMVVSIPGLAPPGAPAETAPKKRPLEDEDTGASSAAQSSGPGKKRRRTSASRSSSASAESSQTKKARVSKDEEAAADDEAYEPAEASLESESGIAQVQDPASNADNAGGVTRRITRSVTQSAAANTTTTTPSTSDSSAKKQKQKKKTKKQKLEEAAKSAKHDDLPSDPSLLSAPAGDDSDWKLRFTVFRKELQKKNPDEVLTPQFLVASVKRYLKEFAWRRQPNRQQQVHDAKKALLKLQLAGALDSVITDDEPEQTAGDEDREGKEEEKEEEAQSTAGPASKSAAKNPKTVLNPPWVYPDDPLLLDPDYPGESFEDSFKRLCQVIVDGDPVGASRFDAHWLEKMAVRWVARKAWTHITQGRKNKIQETMKTIHAMGLSGKLKEIFRSILGPKVDTVEEAPKAEGPSKIEDASKAEDVLMTEDVPKTEEAPKTEEVPKAQEAPKTEESSKPKEASKEQPQPDADASGLPPSASDWAALLGSDAVSEEAPEDTEMVDKPAQPPPEPGRAVMTEQESAEEKLRYFPGLADSDTFCVACAGTDHTALSCPQALCRHCRGEHFAWACPTRRRCTKCKQLGHSAAVCKEKLAMTEDEGQECAFCGASGHLEHECDAMGRSWVSVPETRKKVRHIPAFCGACGIEGHYSSDCTLRGDWGYSPTWTLANRNQYVDPASEREAISALSVPAEPARMGHKIKGAASRNTHIFFDDTDGSEEGEFIGKKVAPKVSTGPIRMSTNIQYAPLAGPSSQPFQGQPPLPPGPPPTGPAPKLGGYSKLAQAPRGPRRPNNNVGNHRFTLSAKFKEPYQPPTMTPFGPSNPGNGRKASGGGDYPPHQQWDEPPLRRRGKGKKQG
ncbi:hypothetical protein F5X68DRAFT_274451 [Plectosphaerella plurivora]|uniref:CCHC-type domain-containing protein n=1 Tax=Plectosphaerella plurivora TaxID=936078 RepID=A0A9P9ACG1_9PEZI|nr:hypothetical protein F5X68DRAFT_274451 [Plectosphaerella plurivora]